ncbi:MAG: helix-turn-helix domain-containing protein [Gammaproteobacteria bacterium]
MAKQRTLKTVLADMEPARRKRVVGRAAEIARVYHALQELRKARAKTQVEVAETLDVTQPYVAKLEQRSDLMLSVLRKYVRSVGGELEIAVTFPDSGRVILSGIGEAEDEPPAPKPRARKKRADQHPA